MSPDEVVVDHRPHVFECQLLDLLDFVRGPETVEIMKDGDPSLQRGRLGYEDEVHGFLDRSGRQERPACLAAGHHVAVVAEDREGVRRDGPRADVEHGRGELSGDLEHVGYHEEEALRRGEGRREGSGLEGAVDRAGSSAFALHLDDRGDRPPDVLFSLRRPLVRPFAHVGRGRDRVDRAHFAAMVSRIGRSLVPVDRNFFPGHFLLLFLVFASREKPTKGSAHGTPNNSCWDPPIQGTI